MKMIKIRIIWFGAIDLKNGGFGLGLKKKRCW